MGDHNSKLRLALESMTLWTTYRIERFDDRLLLRSHAFARKRSPSARRDERQRISRAAELLDALAHLVPSAGDHEGCHHLVGNRGARREKVALRRRPGDGTRGVTQTGGGEIPLVQGDPRK